MHIKFIAIAILSFFLFQYSAQSQLINKLLKKNKPDKWVYGEVIFKNGEKFTGEISFNKLAPKGILKINKDDNLIVANVYNVLEFSYMDSSNMKRHHYYSIKLERNKVFAELLYNGSELLLFGRNEINIVKEVNTGIATGVDGRYTPYKTSGFNRYERYKYYLIDLNSLTVQEVDKKNILDHFSDKEKELKNFISNENLKLKSPESYILLVEKYEQLKLHK
ncbi:hypothetical protein [Marivirga sp.]|uniref:hypothetical protein n=1 Tax=Marivirga sp. TaxID=2018662 RepID=UPI0025F74177|nr:hypothetical protein [Marivirga sp.]